MDVRGVGDMAVTGSADYTGEPVRRADLADFRSVLEFEEAATELALGRVTKARWIREDFGVSATRYHQALLEAITLPEAFAYAPALVARLRRLLDDRRAARTAGRSSLPPRRVARPFHPSLTFPRGA
jgi:hypothetical protein